MNNQRKIHKLRAKIARLSGNGRSVCSQAPQTGTIQVNKEFTIHFDFLDGLLVCLYIALLCVLFWP